MKTVNDFQQHYNADKPISMVTCYDYWSSKIISDTNVDAVLVGDSSAMVMHGYETTLNADIDMIANHTASVKKGLTDKFIVSDLPFLTNLKGQSFFIKAVDKIIKSGAQAIKLEGADTTLDDITLLVKSGIPVMGHLGMTPQSVHQFGGFKVQGKYNGEANKIFEDAKKLQDVGCFAIVLEMVPSILAKEITEELSIPTIGIGAGQYTSGQILVLQDLLGLNNEFNPRFLKKYLDGYQLFVDALNKYNQEVKMQHFPTEKESY